MSTHRLAEAFALSDMGSAAKLLAIYLSDNASPECAFIDVSSKRVQEFCCVIDVSVPGLMRSLVYKGFLQNYEQTSDPDIYRAWFAWFDSPNATRRYKAEVSKEARAYVTKRDVVCVYCGCEEGPFHIDHITPVSRGGSCDVSNLALACAPCNISKRDRTPEEWGGKKDRAFTLEAVVAIRGSKE